MSEKLTSPEDIDKPIMFDQIKDSKEEIEWRKYLVKRIILTIVLVGLTVGGCSYLNKKLGWEDDNIFEESAEAVLKSQTGIDVDLTPNSPEK